MGTALQERLTHLWETPHTLYRRLSTAKRMRNEAGLNTTGGTHANEITFASLDGPSVYAQPLCNKIYRDRKFPGNESLVVYNPGSSPQPPAHRRTATARKKAAK